MKGDEANVFNALDATNDSSGTYAHAALMHCVV